MQFEAFDWQALQPGPIVGVDEVGRGCLAGPVYAAAVIINSKKDFSKYTDSKKLSEKRREEYSLHIKENHLWYIAFATVPEITKYNILWASMLAMKRAVLGLQIKTGHVIVDGLQKIPDLAFVQTTLVKGDLRATPVAAASIIAKVERDQWMKNQDLEYPGYGFSQHKGYCTQTHKEAIEKKGPTPIHRPTFSGVKEHLIQ